MTSSRLTTRYFVAVSAYAAVQTSILVLLSLSGKPRLAVGAFTLLVMLAILFGVTLVLVYDPLLGAMKWMVPQLSRAAAGMIGAALFPVPVLTFWLLFRESGETFATLLVFAVRLPGEILITAFPLAAGGSIFGASAVGRRLQKAA